MANVFTYKDTAIGLFQQAAFGTPAADSAAFVEIACDASFVEPDINFRESHVARANGRTMDVDDVDVDEKGSMPTVTLSNIILRQDDAALLLAAYFQNVTEGAITPFDKTFIYHPTQPEYDNSGGYFFTIMHKLPLSSKSQKIVDCMISDLTFKCDPKGVLTADATFVGRGVLTDDANPTGTWVVSPKQHWKWNDVDVATVDFGTPVSPYIAGFELKLTKTVEPVGQSLGNFATLITKDYGGTLTLDMAWNVDTEPMRGFLKAGTSGDIRIGWGNATPGTNDEDLDFAMHGLLTSAPMADNDALTQQIIFKLFEEISSTTEAITVVVADAIDQTW